MDCGPHGPSYFSGRKLRNSIEKTKFFCPFGGLWFRWSLRDKKLRHSLVKMLFSEVPSLKGVFFSGEVSLCYMKHFFLSFGSILKLSFSRVFMPQSELRFGVYFRLLPETQVEGLTTPSKKNLISICAT